MSLSLDLNFVWFFIFRTQKTIENVCHGSHIRFFIGSGLGDGDFNIHLAFEGLPSNVEEPCFSHLKTHTIFIFLQLVGRPWSSHLAFRWGLGTSMDALVRPPPWSPVSQRSKLSWGVALVILVIRMLQGFRGFRTSFLLHWLYHLYQPTLCTHI